MVHSSQDIQNEEQRNKKKKKEASDQYNYTKAMLSSINLPFIFGGGT